MKANGVTTMLAKRIIPCLDVCEGQVIKGKQFRNPKIIGDVLALAAFYSAEEADELVFYDIKASSDQRSVCPQWINQIAAIINIPFTVAGGIRDRKKAQAILQAGADKISINSPALERPALINELSQEFGSQAVVIGIDSQWLENDYYVFQYSGDETKVINSKRRTSDWIKEVQERGAGEIVLNCMQQDGMQNGYAIEQLSLIRELTQVPLIASGGAGRLEDFLEVFQQGQADGALAASIFHHKKLSILDVKQFLASQNIKVRL